jgi:signal transduction histidine kinase
VLLVLGRRWVHLLLGGALLMPFYLPGETLTRTVTGSSESLLVQLGILAACVPAIAVVGLAGPARSLSGGAARELLKVGVPVTRSRTFEDRLRTSAWSVVHLVAGGVLSALTLALPPLGLLLVVLPWRGTGGWSRAWGPPAGVLLLAALVAAVYVVGAGLTRLAGPLLGPSAADRLAGLRQQVQEQAIRARLARDLHDSLGHALSVISVQAGAGERRLDSDPAFARAAFTAIQDAAFTASEELDRAIALLGAETRTHEPDLGDVERLVQAVRDAGVPVDSRLANGPVPEVVSREMYRVVQESLTNAVRHGEKAPVRVRLDVTGAELRVEVANKIGKGPGRPGRGLRGMTQRVTALGGEIVAGPDETGGEWRVSARVPIDA